MQKCLVVALLLQSVLRVSQYVSDHIIIRLPCPSPRTCSIMSVEAFEGLLTIDYISLVWLYPVCPCYRPLFVMYNF